MALQRRSVVSVIILRSYTGDYHNHKPQSKPIALFDEHRRRPVRGAPPKRDVGVAPLLASLASRFNPNRRARALYRPAAQPLCTRQCRAQTLILILYTVVRVSYLLCWKRVGDKQTIARSKLSDIGISTLASGT